MNMRETFDIIKTHLLTQNAKSQTEISTSEDWPEDWYEDGEPYYSSETICAYRGDNGMKCAVGCIIPDDKYDPSMENVGVICIRDNYGFDWDGPMVNMLKRLQHIHDVIIVSKWKCYLDRYEHELFGVEG